MGYTEFLLGVTGLLVTPGPTNTLMLLAGAERGWTRALRLIPAEVAGYLLAVVPLALAGSAVLPETGTARSVVTALAALWVAWLAIGLWRRPVPGAGGVALGGGRVFVTTLLNPKALVFGLVLVPAVPVGPGIALFAASVAAVALGWTGLGACMAGRADCPARGASRLVQRAAAVWLGLLSAALAAQAWAS